MTNYKLTSKVLLMYSDDDDVKQLVNEYIDMCNQNRQFEIMAFDLHQEVKILKAENRILKAQNAD